MKVLRAYTTSESTEALIESCDLICSNMADIIENCVNECYESKVVASEVSLKRISSLILSNMYFELTQKDVIMTLIRLEYISEIQYDDFNRIFKIVELNSFRMKQPSDFKLPMFSIAGLNYRHPNEYHSMVIQELVDQAYTHVKLSVTRLSISSFVISPLRTNIYLFIAVNMAQRVLVKSNPSYYEDDIRSAFYNLANPLLNSSHFNDRQNYLNYLNKYQAFLLYQLNEILHYGVEFDSGHLMNILFADQYIDIEPNIEFSQSEMQAFNVGLVMTLNWIIDKCEKLLYSEVKL